MTKLALIFMVFLISCSFLSLAAEFQPRFIKCPEKYVPSKRQGPCPAVVATTCLKYKDGSLHVKQGSACADHCYNPQVDSYSHGWCTEEQWKKWQQPIRAIIPPKK